MSRARGRRDHSLVTSLIVQESPAAPLDPGYEVICADALDGLESLPSQSADLLVTSPPYWGLRTYGLDHNDEILDEYRTETDKPEIPPGYEWYRRRGGVLGLEPYPEWYVSHLADILDAAWDVLKPGGSMWLNLGDTYFARWSSIRSEGRQGLAGDSRLRRRTPSGGIRHDKQLLLLPSRCAIELQSRGWILRNDVIWSKPDIGPRPETDRLRLAHEHLFHFVKRRPSRRPAYYYDLSGAEPGARDVVQVPTSLGGDGHSATFPPQLIRPRIATSCPPGGTVLDPFCGTGTALVVALELERAAIGIELSREYAKLARRKLASASARQASTGRVA
ncbi:DNA-methyltransferase [Baekduia sp. Peel2402]|uniref:DNA-methyltransferase n=1 Tax=Baekduia sp. Peel2402 TaxID=3458296 RepID=UPI00403EBD23